MSGITGKGPLSIKKQDVQESRVPALGFKKIMFAHKASAGQTEIDVNSLTLPTEMSANGFVQPSLAEMTAVNMRQFKENITLKSSLRGELMQFLGYTVSSGTKLKLGFSAEEGEIFICTIDAAPRTGITMADAQPLVASGTLSAGTTDFNVGTAFRVGRFPNAQHGEVMVMVDGQLMYRNTGNNAPGAGVEGDYYEVSAGGGLGVLIRFNTPDLVNDRSVSVFSVGSLIQAPNGSEVAMIEALQGQIDQMVPTLAALAGVAESTFQGAPNNVNLKAFGDRVLADEALIAALTARVLQLETNSGTFTPVISNISGASVVTPRVFQWMKVGRVVTMSGLFVVTPTAGGGAAVSFRFTLPGTTANFTDETQLAGSGGTQNAGNSAIRMLATVGAQTGALDFQSFSATSTFVPVNFTFLLV